MLELFIAVLGTHTGSARAPKCLCPFREQGGNIAAFIIFLSLHMSSWVAFCTGCSYIAVPHAPLWLSHAFAFELEIWVSVNSAKSYSQNQHALINILLTHWHWEWHIIIFIVALLFCKTLYYVLAYVVIFSNLSCNVCLSLLTGFLKKALEDLNVRLS